MARCIDLEDGHVSFTRKNEGYISSGIAASEVCTRLRVFSCYEYHTKFLPTVWMGGDL